MSVAANLGAFFASASPGDLPVPAHDYATMLVASTLASAAVGTTIRSARIIRGLAASQGGIGRSTLWFDQRRTLPAAMAAQANAVTSDSAASDDSDLRTIVHAGTPATAAALALAEAEQADGESVLVAIVLGYEAAARLAAVITPGFRDRGFHGCVGAIFAATVAAGRLIRLDETQMAHAIALSATSIGGIGTAADTSTAREYHAGLATLLGVNAALAARGGFESELGILEMPRGYFEVLGGVDGPTTGDAATRGLGEEWSILTDMAIKLVPGAHALHSIAEAAAAAARDGDIVAAEVDRIVITRPDMARLAEPLHPTDLVSMAHSPAYFAAAGVADRDFSWVHAAQSKIVDPVIHRLIDRVEIGGTVPPAEAFRYHQGSTVTIHTLHGSSSTATVFVPKGAAALGISWADVDDKFRALVPASGLADDRIEAALALIHGLGALDGVDELIGLLGRVGSDTPTADRAER